MRAAASAASQAASHFPFALGLARAGVPGRHVQADNPHRPGRRGQDDRRGPGRQVPDPVAEPVVRGRGHGGDDHRAVFAGTRPRKVHGVARGGELLGEQQASRAGLGLGEDQDVLVTPDEPGQLPPGTVGGRVADVERQQGKAGHGHDR